MTVNRKIMMSAPDVNLIAMVEARLEVRRRLNLLDEYHLKRCPDYQRAFWESRDRTPVIIYNNGGRPSLAVWWSLNAFRYKPREPE